jgi:exo-beta-1,3-glucanase (GH17 family)
MLRALCWLVPPAVLLILAVVVTLAWWWPNRPQAADVAIPAARFNSVSYAPFRPGQSPFTDTFPSATEVDQDLALLAERSRAIRSYAAIGGDYDLAAIAARHGLKLWQGIWLGSDRAQNAREIAAGIAIANRYPDTVERVVVGNEVLLRRDLPVDELIADIDQVRRAVKQPVTYADVWEFWRQNPEVAAHVDSVTVHLLPYWEDTPTGIDRAVAHVAETYHAMVGLFPGKQVVIGETGWPSRGRWRQDAAPGPVNQAMFLRRFIALSQREGFDYNLIEAFDQDWKYRSEGTVGANWGIWTADRRAKFPLSGAIVEDPNWRGEAGASIVVGLLLFAAVQWRQRCFIRSPSPLPLVRQRRRNVGSIAALAMTLGWALVWAWAGTVPIVYDDYLAVAAIGNLVGQALLAVLLLDRVASGRTPPPRFGAQATATVRNLFRLELPRAPIRTWLFDDLSFVFVWTAAVLQLLLLFDPRYRDFPLPVFIVPLVATLVRIALRDLPSGGGREELLAGGALALAAVASAINEGRLNLPSLTWNAVAVILAAPALLSLRRRASEPGPGA